MPAAAMSYFYHLVPVIKIHDVRSQGTVISTIIFICATRKSDGSLIG